MVKFILTFSKDNKKLSLSLIFILLMIGAISQILAFFDFYHPLLSMLLILPIVNIYFIFYNFLSELPSYSVYQKTLSIFFIIVWISHLIQVFVPETGFDAVWYHLPVIKLVTQNHGLSFSPNFYQSLNPLFSDLIFGLGFFTLTDLGAKLVAYLFGLSLIIVSYQLSLRFLNKTFALLFIFMISTFQVISWQSASFYVDVAKAFWELSSLWLLLIYLEDDKKSISYLTGSALNFSASLATKAFSILLTPFWLLIILMKKRYASVFIFLTIAVILPVPFFIHSYLETGDFFYLYHQVSPSLLSVSGYQSLPIYLREKTLGLLISPIVLAFSSDYICSGILLLLPMIVWKIKIINAKFETKVLLIFSAWQWLIWWYVPPLSTRYALSGFITLSLLLIWLVSKLKYYKIKRLIFGLLIISIWINILPRLYVNLRSSRYLLGFENKEQYLQQFYDGWTDDVLKKWHEKTN